MKPLKRKLSSKIIIFILSFIILFHLLVLLGVIPYNMVWGGQLEQDPSPLFTLEIISITMNLFIIVVTSMRAGFIKSLLSPKVIRFFMWAFSILFTINTIGNFLSDNHLEKMIFTPLTIVLAILFYTLTRAQEGSQKSPLTKSA